MNRKIYNFLCKYILILLTIILFLSNFLLTYFGRAYNLEGFNPEHTPFLENFFVLLAAMGIPLYIICFIMYFVLNHRRILKIEENRDNCSVYDVAFSPSNGMRLFGIRDILNKKYKSYGSSYVTTGQTVYFDEEGEETENRSSVAEAIDKFRRREKFNS